MSYFLGIDLGTTYTAAAVWRDGRVEVAGLGGRAPVIPSVVLVREGGHVLTGEAAARRAIVEPQRIAREFKRRMGDQTPIILAGAYYSPEALTARLLQAVVGKVHADQDGPPAAIAVTHPANWTGYRKDLLRQAVHLADVGEVTLVSEPEAAAIHYASQERVDPGSVVAAYDLGGGTFDAAVLRHTVTGWQILGWPEGVERLGGVDFDEAVFHHVVRAAGPAYECLDPDDPTARAAVTRLRQECVDAKEALTSDTDVTIPVLLPTLHSEVRLTRAEFEDMIRPALGDTITALRRALRSASVAPEDVCAVVLVGGSSRIPLVAQMVSSALGRPVAVDAHPKHSVALGAAIIAADQASPGAATTSEVGPVDETTPPATFWTAPTTPVGGTGRVAVLAAPAPTTAPAVTAPAGPSLRRAAAARPATRSLTRSAGPQLTPPPSRPMPRGHVAPLRPPRRPRQAKLPPRRSVAELAEIAEIERRRRRAFALIVGGAAVLLVAFGSVVALGGDDDGDAPTEPGGVPAKVLPGATDPDRPLSSGQPDGSSSTATATPQPGPRTTPSPQAVPPATAPTTTAESTTTTGSTTTTSVAPTTTEADQTTTTTEP